MHFESNRRSEAQFLTVPVSNTVIDVNPEFQKQLEIDVGDSSELVRLWSPPEERGILLGAEARHNRIANVDNTFVVDANGLRWEDIDVKSPGLTEVGHGPSGDEVQLFPWTRMVETPFAEAKIWGGNDLASARHAFKYQHILEKIGVRTYKSLFVTKLNEWMYKGNKVPISEIPVAAKDAEVKGENDAIPEGYVLAAEVRACRIKTRMQAIEERSAPSEENRAYIRREIDRARKLVAEEKGLPDLSVNDYLEWFIDAHGQNLGRMHAGGYVHRFMHAGNVTLDCRILDLDSMQTFSEAHAAEKERLAQYYGTTVLQEASRENFVIRDSRTVHLAVFARIVSAAYDMPFSLNVSKRFLSAYTQAQAHIPPELRTVRYAEKAQERS